MKRRTYIKTMSAVGIGLPLQSLSSLFNKENYFDQGIYIFSKHLQWLDYKKMAKAAKEIGFDGVDLTVRPKGHVLPENVKKDLPKAVKAIRKAGLKADLMTTAITGADEEYTEEILKTASELGIKSYRLGWLKYEDNTPIEAQLEKHKKQLEVLAQMNKHFNIRGDYQNHAGDSVGSPVWDIWYLIKDIDPQWLGCRYDVRHGMAEGLNSWKLGLRLLQKHIQTLDLKDYTYFQDDGKWSIQNTPIGEGAVDFDDYFKTLHQLKLNKPFTLHAEYELGGANKGAYEINITPKKVLTALKSDLNSLRLSINKANEK